MLDLQALAPKVEIWRICANAPNLRQASRALHADHGAVDVQQAAIITINRALARAPLQRRKRALKLLAAAGYRVSRPKLA